MLSFVPSAFYKTAIMIVFLSKLVSYLLRSSRSVLLQASLSVGASCIPSLLVVVRFTSEAGKVCADSRSGVHNPLRFRFATSLSSLRACELVLRTHASAPEDAVCRVCVLYSTNYKPSQGYCRWRSIRRQRVYRPIDLREDPPTTN